MKRTHQRHKSRRQKRAMARHTHKIRSCTKKDGKAIITENFLEMLNEIKIYHWNTHSFAQHKATDELYSQLNEHVDKFVEGYAGKKRRPNHQIIQTRSSAYKPNNQIVTRQNLPIPRLFNSYGKMLASKRRHRPSQYPRRNPCRYQSVPISTYIE